MLEELVIDLGLGGHIKCMTSPMQIRFPNGSKIIFKGMDKLQKLKNETSTANETIEKALSNITGNMSRISGASSELAYLVEDFSEIIDKLNSVSREMEHFMKKVIK